MPRPPRPDLPGIPLHVFQRGVDRQPVFFVDADYLAYLDWLGKSAAHYGVEIHAWCLMTNHVHFLVTPRRPRALSLTLASLGRQYVPYINHVYGRTGTLWEGRYKAALVDNDGYLLACYHYIELNPVSARMVADPGDYRWSSFRTNALGEDSSIVTPHPTYAALGESAKARCRAYRDLFEQHPNLDIVQEIESALSHNHVLGNDRFRAEIERMLGRRLGNGRPGRPRKPGNKE